MRGWVFLVAGLVLIALGGGLAHMIQTADSVTVEDIRIELEDGRQLSALLYKPAGATDETPAPGILAVHGYINSRETQSGFAIEFARRGYVVLALDQTGHGFSDGPAFSNGFGGPPALAYLRKLPFVDQDRIGLEGHSMGGWTVLAAAAAYPEAYRSIALVGSSTGSGFAPEGTTDFPRNLAVIFSRYDEFSQLMWETENAADVAQSEKLQALFGADTAVTSRQLYGSIADGTARWLATPDTTHAGAHLSNEAIGDAVFWMNQTLGGGQDLSDADQIWFWKEIGTLTALIGAMVLLLGSFDVLIGGRQSGVPASGGADRLSAGWGIRLTVTALLPALTYFPLIIVGLALPANMLFPQSITNQIMVWALGNGVIALLMLWFQRGHKDGFALRPALAALGAVAAVYGVVYLADHVLTVDFRFWVVALKPLASHHLLIALAYLIPFTVFFYISQRAMQAGLMVTGASAPVQYATGMIAAAGGMAILVGGLYVFLYATGHLPHPDLALFTIVAIQFVPVLAMTGIIAVFTWRRTNSALPGALISGLLVTGYIVAGQATHL